MRFLYSKKNIYFLAFLLLATPAIAQHTTAYAENAVGKIRGTETSDVFKQINSVKNLDKTKAASLKKCLGAQLKIFYSGPLFNPPTGFNARTSFNITTDPFVKTTYFLPCHFAFDLYYLVKDNKTGGVKESMDGTSLGMEINAENHYFRQVGNFWKDCSNAKFPLFFEQLPITDSTADYIEMDFKKYGYAHIAPNKPFRIIRRNNKPLFIPLTRKEFLQFLIAHKKYQIQEDEKTIAGLQKDMKETQETLKNPPSYLQPSTIKALADGNSTLQKNITKMQEGIYNSRATTGEYEKVIKAMPPQEAASPARIDENKIAGDLDDLNRLVPPGNPEGVGLYKINPGYYDHRATAPGAQLIFVHYHLVILGAYEKKQLDYLEKKTVDIFDHLDYHALKMSML